MIELCRGKIELAQEGWYRQRGKPIYEAYKVYDIIIAKSSKGKLNIKILDFEILKIPIETIGRAIIYFQQVTKGNKLKEYPLLEMNKINTDRIPWSIKIYHIMSLSIPNEKVRDMIVAEAAKIILLKEVE